MSSSAGAESIVLIDKDGNSSIVDDVFDSLDGLSLFKPDPLPPVSTLLSVLVQHRITFQEKFGRTRAKFVAAFKKAFPTAIFAADVNELWTAVHKTDSVFNLSVIQVYCNFVSQHGYVSEFHRCEVQNSIVPL